MNILNKVIELLENVKIKRPLIHHITNYVTVNDCANVVLALGGSPIMADDIKEVTEIVALADALVLNMGTLNSRTIRSMLIAGKKANKLGIPVIFDPVGVGASNLRKMIAHRIIADLKLAVIKGNISEIKVLSGKKTISKGVDASEKDLLAIDNLNLSREIASKLAAKTNAVVVITGAIDVIASKNNTYFLHNGPEILGKITGSGCMCSSLVATYCSVTNDYLYGALAGILTMGLAGELSYGNMEKDKNGIGTFRAGLIDAFENITPSLLKERSKITIYSSETGKEMPL